MNWLKPEKYAMRSECGRYTVSKAFVCGPTIYTAWYGSQRLSNHAQNKEAAQRACERHNEATEHET